MMDGELGAAMESIKRRTGLDDGWEFIDGPDSRVGVDYWLQHSSGVTAYVNIDQGEVTIQIQSDEEG
jgi:hypothetical protein